MVRIGVDDANKEEAERCLHEEFPDSHDIYEICDPWESSCQPSIPADENEWLHQVIELGPSTRIVCNKKLFLFSGAVVSRQRGITVGHATSEGGEIVLDSHPNKTVGRCKSMYDNLIRQNGEKLSADLALLELHKCSVDNTIRWPFPAGRVLQVKIYKGQRVPDDTRVMVLDQNGHFQYGSIRRDHLTDMRLQDKDLHSVLAISTKKGQNEVSITQLGDSGALVTSLPSKDSIVHVYGIVNSIYTEPTNGRSLTVACSLWDVIHELIINPKYSTEFKAKIDNNNIGESIDFI